MDLHIYCMSTSTAFGIDLGTTNSLSGIYKNGKIDIIADKNGSHLVPSYVQFIDNGDPPYVVGRVPKDKMKTRPQEIIYGSKRFIGLTMDDPMISRLKESVSYEVKPGDNNRPLLCTKSKHPRENYPEQIASYILKYLKGYSSTFAGFDIKDVVITVPARYTELQRQIIRDAAHIADLNVLEIITEPVAAAYAYADAIDNDKPRTVLIYDLGGGTFDITIMRVDGLNYTQFALGGDEFLGGNDFDVIIMKEVLRYIDEEGFNRPNDKRMGRLRSECEDAKKSLAALEDVDISIGDGEFYNLTRSHMEELLKNHIQRTLDLCDEAIKEANLQVSDIDDILLVGGSCRLLLVRKMLQDHFSISIKEIVNPDEAVAYGATKYANHLIHQGDPIKTNIQTICPSNIGLQNYDDQMIVLIKKSQCLPATTKIKVKNSLPNVNIIPFRVYQGNNTHCRNNTRLNETIIRVANPGPVGTNVFEVTFTMTKQGNLSLSIKDTKTQQKVDCDNIQPILTSQQIEDMRNKLKEDEQKCRDYDIRMNRLNKLKERHLNIRYIIQNQEDKDELMRISRSCNQGPITNELLNEYENCINKYE